MLLDTETQVDLAGSAAPTDTQRPDISQSFVDIQGQLDAAAGDQLRQVGDANPFALAAENNDTLMELAVRVPNKAKQTVRGIFDWVGEQPSPGKQVDPESEIDDMPAPEGLIPLMEGMEEPEFRDWRRNINLDHIQNENDIGKLLEVQSQKIPEMEHESFAEIEAQAGGEALASWLGEGPQNLNSRQLLAGRQLLVSMTNEVRAMAGGIASGELRTPDDYMAYEKLAEQTVMLQKYMQGQIRETARALNSMKIMARTLKQADYDIIEQGLGERGDATAVRERARALVDIQEKAIEDGKTPDQALVDTLETMAKLQDKKTMRAIVRFWMASILSGPQTQWANVVGNATLQAYESVGVKGMAAAIGGVRNLRSSTQDRLTAAEWRIDMWASLTALQDAWRSAAHVYLKGAKTGEYNVTVGRNRVEQEGHSAPFLGEGMANAPGIGKLFGTVDSSGRYEGNMAGKGLDYVSRAVEAFSYGPLSAGDEFFKVIAYRRQLAAGAMRQAVSEGLTGKALRERVNDLMRVDNPKQADVDMVEAINDNALAFADHQTFTDSPEGVIGDVARGISGFAEQYPSFKFIVPFTKTPTNLIQYATQSSPFAPFTKQYQTQIDAGGAEADLARARMVNGTALLALFVYLHDAEIITGKGYGDHKKNKAMMGAGWKPNHIRFGDTWVEYRRVEPFGTLMGFVADSADMMKYAQTEQEWYEIAAQAAFVLGHYSMELPFMQGTKNLFDALSNPERGASRMGSNILAGFVPSLFKSAAVATQSEVDGVIANRTAWPNDGVIDAIVRSAATRVPGWRNRMAVSRHWDGTPIGSTSYPAHMLNTLGPVKFSEVSRNDPLSVELAANAVGIPNVLPAIKIGPAQIPIMNLPGSTELYDKLQVLVGEQRRVAVEGVVGSEAYPSLSTGAGGDRQVELVSAIMAGSTAGKGLFLEHLMEEAEKDTEQGRALNEAIGQLLDDEALIDMVERGRADELTPEERKLIKKFKIRGIAQTPAFSVPGQEDVQVPDF